jgi:hypothetical protein
MAEQTRISRRSARLFAFVLLVISVGFATGMAEVAVRIAAPQQLIMLRPDLWEPADTVGWDRRPNVSAEINTGEGKVHLVTDAEGFRVRQTGRREGIPVLLLGDSFMEALQVEYEQSLSGVLDDLLSKELGKPVAVRNAGINGWAPSQYLLKARALLPHNDYRMIVTAVYVGNDAPPIKVDYFPPRQRVERHTLRLPRNLSVGEFIDAGLRPVNDFFEVRSHLFILLRKQLETLRMKSGTSPTYFPNEFLKTEANAERWQIAADFCSQINELAKQKGIPALFVLIPSDFQVDPEKFNQYVRGFAIDTTAVDLDQPSRRLAEELSKRGLNVIDPLTRFREMHNSGQRLYGKVDQHMNAAGHQALGEIVAPVAAKLLEQAQ